MHHETGSVAIFRRALTCLACFLFTFAAIVHAGDWPHWRGPNRNDVVDAPSGWDGTRWPGRELWSTNVGIGCTSSIVVDSRLYVMGWDEGRDTVRCLDTASGRELWKSSYDCPKYGRVSVGDKGIYAGCTSTPEFDPQTGRLYSLSIDGDLICWDGRDGRSLWNVNLYDRYQVGRRPEVAKRRKTRRDYGYTSSPLVYGDWVIVEVGDDSGTLVAFDKTSGRQRWASQCKDEAGHTGGPVLMTVEGVPCVAVLTLRNLVVVRLDMGRAGETVAQYPWTTDFGNNIATPAVSGNSVIVTSAYNHYAMCRLDVTLKNGAEKVWQRDVASGVCSPIIHRGHVYWVWRGVHCLDFGTGEEKWSGGNVGSTGSCIVTADERLIVWANKGDLSLAETAERAPGRFRELVRQPHLFQADVWPHVVLAGGRLYCKDRQGNLKCLSAGSE